MKILNLFKKYLAKQDFNPDVFGVFFNPFYITRRSIYASMKKFSLYFKGGALLDIGCGTKPYKELFETDAYWGVDIRGGGHSDEAKHCDIYYDGGVLPVKSCSVDSVLTSQVLEHVINQDLFVKEIYRVLRPGGHLFLSVPLVWDEHEQPYDYYRYTSFGIKHLLENNGFVIREYFKSTTYLEAIFQMLSAYVFNFSIRLNKYIHFFIVATVCSVIQITGLLISKLLPDGGQFYLDNIVLAVKEKD